MNEHIDKKAGITKEKSEIVSLTIYYSGVTVYLSAFKSIYI